jgi:hypothetical protein
MRSWQGARSILWPVAVGLVLYCLAVTALTGDIGFEGDDWWIFSWPYRNGFPASLLAYAEASLRPVEGIYWITLFEIFGFNKIAFNLCSLLLLSGACLMMGWCLLTAFPQKRSFAVLAILFAFFLPTVSCLTYVICTDNSRLSMLLFWACVAGFQRWSARGLSWPDLFAPVALYVLAFLAYEAPSFLLFVIPFLVWPVWLRHRSGSSSRDFLIGLGTAVVAAFAISVSIRFLLLSGGAVSHQSLLPSWELMWSYIALIPFYLSAPFTSMSWDPATACLGIGVMIWSGILAVRSFSTEDEKRPISGPFLSNDRSYLILLGIAILILGMLPYQLAGYGSITPKIANTVVAKWGIIPDGNTSWFNFNWSSRIYSAGSFGLAIIFAAILTNWRLVTVKIATTLTAAAALGLMAIFHAGLSADWKEAAHIRNELLSSLISQVPDVKPGANFVFLDLESSYGRAPIFRGWGGLKELIRMLYDDEGLGAWYLYPYSWQRPNKMFHQAVVTRNGFVTRGMRMERPAPHDSLLILARRGSQLVLLDNISSHDGWAPTGIRWSGASEIHSNFDRIVAWSDTHLTQKRFVRNAWNSGLIATLQLYKVRLSLRIANKWGSSLYNPRLRKSWMKK